MTARNLVESAGEQAQGLLANLFGSASPSQVFSEGRAVGEDLVITVAAFERAGGFGFGGGGDNEENGGGGGGGGGVSQARPVAVIRLTPTGTEVTPVFDMTKIAVTVVLSAVGVWRALRS